jgi:hypothetical protein
MRDEPVEGCRSATAQEPLPSYRCDRRAWVRYSCDHTVTCQPSTQPSGVYWPARVQNISAGGLALLLHHRVEEGMLLAVTIQPATGCSRTLHVRIARLSVMTAHPGLRWLAGCVFVEPLDDDLLNALLE